MCGGTASNRAFNWLYRGLSPRVRGNLYRSEAEILLSGTIPACAGEPKALHPACHEREDYPRVCGGTPRLIMGAVSLSASMPCPLVCVSQELQLIEVMLRREISDR